MNALTARILKAFGLTTIAAAEAAVASEQEHTAYVAARMGGNLVAAHKRAEAAELAIAQREARERFLFAEENGTLV